MTAIETFSKVNGEACDATAYLVLDCESVPDGRLLNLVKYPGEGLTPTEAVARAQAEARQRSSDGSDFLPVTFQYPVAVCVIRVAADYRLQAVKCLDAPAFRPRAIVEEFWKGVGYHKSRGPAQLVSFNGRGFDLPLLELAAFRYGCGGTEYFRKGRNRFSGELDLMDWLTNYGAFRLAGGLQLLAKILGKPGKMEVAGDQVYKLFLEGRLQEINDYCMFDTLDTYFVFLRTRVLCGVLTLAQEHALVSQAKAWLTQKEAELPALGQYLANWGDWQAWP